MPPRQQLRVTLITLTEYFRDCTLRAISQQYLVSVSRQIYSQVSLTLVTLTEEVN